MKKIISILLVNFFSQTNYGQVVAIQNELQNILYQYYANPVTVAVSGINPDNLFVSTSNGQISIDSPGHYVLWPLTPGRTVIYIKWKLPSGKWQANDSVLFIVKPYPLPHATLIGKEGGTISQSFLLALITPEAHMYEGCGSFPVTKFCIAVYRGHREIFKRTIIDSPVARIDDTTRDFFYKLKINDKVVFKNITIKGFDHKQIDIGPMEFTITEAHKYRKVNGNETTTVIDPITGVESQREIKYKFIRDDDEEY